MVGMSEIVTLSTGAELRLTGDGRERMVVCVNGGQAAEVAGTWSASLEWLVARLAPHHPELGFAEVRYRVKSWRQLDRCVEDTAAAIVAAGGERTMLLGFSMGGAVSIRAAAGDGVERVLGLAPWIPDRLGFETLAGRRLDVIHGSLDRWLPGIPGVSAASSRRGFDRARAARVPGSYTLLHGALHGIAVRSPSGRLVPLPRASAWTRAVSAQLASF